jgi:hypothetical protein
MRAAQRLAETRRPDGGQALLEMTVALVALVVLLIALLELGRLSQVHLDVMNTARERAGRYALAPAYNSGAVPQYLANWRTGTDGRRYTRSDRPVPGTEALIRQRVLSHAHPAELRAFAPGNAVSQAMDVEPLVAHFRLVGAREESAPLPLLSATQQLLYRADAVTLEASAWSVWMRGLE